MIAYQRCLAALLVRQSRFTITTLSRNFCTTRENTENPEEEEKKRKHEEFVKRALILKGSFENSKEKDKNNYLEMVKIFEDKDVHRRNHVEFIYAALKNMEDFGVHKDLEVYKALINVMPKGKFIPTNFIQVEFMHYPKQQQCIIDLLEQMEDNGRIFISIMLTIANGRLYF